LCATTQLRRSYAFGFVDVSIVHHSHTHTLALHTPTHTLSTTLPIHIYPHQRYIYQTHGSFAHIPTRPDFHSPHRLTPFYLAPSLTPPHVLSYHLTASTLTTPSSHHPPTVPPPSSHRPPRSSQAPTPSHAYFLTHLLTLAHASPIVVFRRWVFDVLVHHRNPCFKISKYSALQACDHD
jgi:hypothetical protein